jgi:hypothetical protein
MEKPNEEKTVADFMEDADIKDLPFVNKEIRAIRRFFYYQTKGMTFEERAAWHEQHSKERDEEVKKYRESPDYKEISSAIFN